MLLIAEHRNQGFRHNFRNFNPGTASAKATLHREADRRLQAVNPYKGNMNAREFFVVLRVSKPILDHRGIKHMQLGKPVNSLLVIETPTPFDGCGVSKCHIIRILFRKNKMLHPDLLRLRMEPGRKKVELGVLESELVCFFGNPTFAKENTLLSSSEGITDKSPFFERYRHPYFLPLHGHSHKVKIGTNFGGLASRAFSRNNTPLMLHSFDLHLHTFYSPDGCASPEAMLDAAKRRGLSGMAVTDHNTCAAIEHLTAAGLMRVDGSAVDGFLIIPGVEVSTSDGHLICLGTTLPDMKGQPAIEVVKAIHARGGIAIAPHPFDSFRAGIREEVLDQLPLTALETFNSAVTLRSFNRKAADYAARRGLAATSSSDAHHASAAGICSTAYELPELTLPALLAAIPGGGRRTENYLPFAESMKKNFGNWFRLFNPVPMGKG